MSFDPAGTRAALPADLTARDLPLLYAALLEKLPTAAYLCDPEGRITYFNEQAEKVWGRAPRLNDGTDLYCGSFKMFALDGSPLPHAQCWMARAIHEDREFIGKEIVIEQPNGDRVTGLANASPLRDRSGRLLGAINVVVDVTEQKRTEEALRRSEEALRRIDRRKDEFLAMLAHELRNPLHPLSNAVEVLRLSGPQDPQWTGLYEVVERQVSQLVRLIDDLVDVSRLTRNRLELRREPVELRAIIESSVATGRPLVERQRHALSVSIPRASVLLFADPVRLAQVFANLLDNAAKYTPRGGHIRLVAELEAEPDNGGDPQAVRVSIRDDGIGIPAAELPMIFDLFAQVDRSPDRPRDGLGVGLTLVRSIVELHGGSVEGESPGPGLGSCFTVRLPVHALPVSPRREADAGAEQEVTPRQRILVVDDREDAATSMELLLRRLGHDTWTAFDGAQALDRARELRPDLVLLDVGLPVHDGYEVCRRIRSEPWGGAIRIVAVTGWGQEEHRRRTSEAGFDAHLAKPVTLADLKRLLGAEPRASG